MVAPLIDESESLDVKSATEIFEELRHKFRKYRVALLHGELKQAEKDAIMERFYGGEIDILVAASGH